MNLLIAIPYLPSLHPLLLDRMHQLAHALADATPGSDLAIVDGTVCMPSDAPPYAAHATARNRLLDQRLRPEHTHVLWIDSDLVDYPADLVQQLDQAAPGCIVAPQVLIEGTHQFYDTSGFIEDGWQANATPPYFVQAGPLVELDAVGCCYLIPASIYHAGHRYQPQRGHTEHASICLAARQMGISTYCDTRFTVYHADLPRYGQRWH